MQKIGGGGQPLSYTNPNAYEPSARGGSDLLGSSTVRPALPIKGGFVPSVMGNFVQNAPVLVPLVTTAAYRLLSNKTRKMRGGVKDWETLRYEAKRDLTTIGKASAVNINRLAGIRKRGESNAAFIEDFTARKGNTYAPQAPVNNVLTTIVKPKKAKKTVTIKAPATSKWQQNKQRAKNYLSRLGKPSGPNIASYASMLRKGENTSEFLNEFQSRVPKVKAKAEPSAKAPVVPRPSSVRAALIKVPVSAATPAAAIAASLAKIKSKIAKQKAQEPEPEPSLLPLPQNPLATTQKKKRVLGPKGLTLKENRQRAKEFLLQHGKPSGKNIIKFTSIRRKANAQAEDEFLTAFKSRYLEAPVVQEANNEVEEVVEEEVPAPAKKSRVTSSASIDQWKLNKQRAKELLDRIGSATAAEVSKLASMMRKGSDTSEFITSIQSRVNQTRKRLTMLKQKKDLSAVQEVNNENNVEEYSLPNNSAKPLLNNSSRNVQPSGLEESSTYRPPPFVATNTRKNGKVPVENFRKHLQLLKQKLQREKV
jgi:hypothetical protein